MTTILGLIIAIAASLCFAAVVAFKINQAFNGE